jgi:hypothetical protein
MSNLPFMQFYTGDYMREQSLRSFGERSAEIRGCWVDMLCLMYDSPERGVLLLPSGVPYCADSLYGIFGLTLQRTKENLRLMKDTGVFDIRASDGAMISRRMIRDDIMHKINQERGKKGGNPALVNQGKGKKQEPKEQGVLGNVLTERELALLKHLPALRRYESQPEAVKQIVRYCLTRRKEFPEIIAFINTALSTGHQALSVCSSLRRLFELSDSGKLRGRGGKAENNFAYARKLLNDPNLSDTELNRLLSESGKRNLHINQETPSSLGDILKSIGAENGKDKKH